MEGSGGKSNHAQLLLMSVKHDRQSTLGLRSFVLIAHRLTHDGGSRGTDCCPRAGLVAARMEGRTGCLRSSLAGSQTCAGIQPASTIYSRLNWTGCGSPCFYPPQMSPAWNRLHLSL